MVDFIIRAAEDRDLDGWLPLWSAYNRFYRRSADDAVTRQTWGRFLDPGEPVQALVADAGTALVGMVHFIFHRNTWMLGDVCYLQDLFTAPEARGQGVARALIEAVCSAAEQAGSSRVYWLTHETNRQAMILYDRVAERSGFVQYRRELPGRPAPGVANP